MKFILVSNNTIPVIATIRSKIRFQRASSSFRLLKRTMSIFLIPSSAESQLGVRCRLCRNPD